VKQLLFDWIASLNPVVASELWDWLDQTPAQNVIEELIEVASKRATEP
jgi:hypothetical protein